MVLTFSTYGRVGCHFPSLRVYSAGSDKVHIECLEVICGFLGAEYLPIEGSSASRRLRVLISIFRTKQ